MHFHLPKPLHGWRAFAGEVGIIVVGVLIALAAEQAVQEFRERAQLREAEGAMRAELRNDDLPQAFARAAVNDCFAAQLDGIENAVASGDREKVLALARDYGPVFRVWDDSAWKAASTSQPFIESGTDRMLRWAAAAYSSLPVMTQEATEEQSELPHLRARLSGIGRLSPGQQDRLFQVIATLRRHNARMTGGAIAFTHYTGEVGLTLSEQDKAEILAEARHKYGSCAKEPALGVTDFSSYYSTSRPRD